MVGVNGFFNGLYPGQTVQCFIHGTYDGDRHFARYLIPDRYARYQSSNDCDNPLELVACKQGWMLRDDYTLFGFIPKGYELHPKVLDLVYPSRREELVILINYAITRGDINGSPEG